VGGDRGQGPGRIGGSRWERKGWEAAILRGRDCGEKCKMLIFVIH